MKFTDLPRATFPPPPDIDIEFWITPSRVVRSRIKITIKRHVAHHFHSAVPVSRCSHRDQSGVTAQMH